MNPGDQEPIEFDEELDELERLSNGVLDLIDAGRHEDAERLCHELERRFPDEVDWIDRTGSLHEARGDRKTAIRYYGLCLEFIERNPEGFDESSKNWYRGEIERLKSIQ